MKWCGTVRMNCTIFIFYWVREQLLGHCNALAWEVRIILHALPHLNTSWRIPIARQQREDIVLQGIERDWEELEVQSLLIWFVCVCVWGGTHFTSLTSKYNETEVWRQSTCTHTQDGTMSPHTHLTFLHYGSTSVQHLHNNCLASDLQGEDRAWWQTTYHC